MPLLFLQPFPKIRTPKLCYFSKVLLFKKYHYNNDIGLILHIFVHSIFSSVALDSL
jgi:hypothetical protein